MQLSNPAATNPSLPYVESIWLHAASDHLPVLIGRVVGSTPSQDRTPSVHEPTSRTPPIKVNSGERLQCNNSLYSRIVHKNGGPRWI
ncbi:hypothetical protein ASPTUDRAFT_48272 [Aspergillus tubingensis CBS 134.48]|uniref:Uncharacterized protein n=1 Tax=Aspergillus tubingensis (strain CBS 134.48) TaxID=767770 RepID=A0A1L9MRV2_ASPTC|nr:hypothetical protein ASPTUDRAFT_48272 [Aspergillus tubingensis CBS 134.48]